MTKRISGENGSNYSELNSVAVFKWIQWKIHIFLNTWKIELIIQDKQKILIKITWLICTKLHPLSLRREGTLIFHHINSFCKNLNIGPSNIHKHIILMFFISRKLNLKNTYFRCDEKTEKCARAERIGRFFFSSLKDLFWSLWPKKNCYTKWNKTLFLKEFF